jgi:hypothetical protein
MRSLCNSVTCAVALVLSVAAAGCAGLPPDQQLVAEAADALGGRSRILALTSIEITGDGEAPNIGQNTLPDGELPVWKVTEYTRTTDLANRRTVVRQVRTAQFPFAGATVQRPHQAVDGDVAFNVGADGSPVRAGAEDARDRHLEALHHPVVAVRAALEPTSLVAGLRQQGDDDLVDVRTSLGETFTLAVSRTTKLPSSIRTVAAHPNLGDVEVVTRVTEYADVSGIKVPTRLTTTLDTYVQLDLRRSGHRLDVDTSGLAAPDAVKAAPLPAPPAVVVTVEPVAKGIWRLAGSGNHRSIVFEFADHLVLFEAPLHEARSKAVIDAARKLSSKPLTHAVVSHHHFDHSGGLRVAVAEGLTVITHKANDAFFRDLVARPWTLRPDALAKSPKPLMLQLVDDSLTLEDATMTVQLYHLLDNTREGTNLYAYVPRERILVQADLYDSTWLRHLWGENVLDNVKRRGLAVDRDVPVHGAMEPFADMVRTIRSKTGS